MKLDLEPSCVRTPALDCASLPRDPCDAGLVRTQDIFLAGQSKALTVFLLLLLLLFCF